MKSACFFLVCATILVPDFLKARAATTNAPIARAMASVAEAAARVQADATRPIYHVLAPANWMNDPNGPIYHRGYYHLFYQHNPYGDNWGHMHWGHVRSRDLAHWERLPIALWPSKEAGEDHVFSGCATINGKGRPMIFYTSIGRGKSASDYAEQWAAFGDKDLITWQKHPANPVLSETLHGDLKVYDWRDPFVFQHERRTFMVLGGNLNHAKGGQAVVNLYEAQNADLTQWKFLDVLFRHPDPKVVNIECPNFFKLGAQWVLLVSPHGRVQYFVGDFDAATHQFRPHKQGLVDYSGTCYAPNCLLDPKGRRIMWGWIRGFKSGLGWNGSLTVPRLLALARNGELEQRPAPELKKLRGEHFGKSNLLLTDSKPVVVEMNGDALEVVAEFSLGNATAVGLKLRGSADGQRAVTIAYDGGQLDVAGTKAPFKLRAAEKTLKLHVFLDKSVLEVFANDRACFARPIDAGKDDLSVAVFATGGDATLRKLDVWRMGSIW